MIDFNKPVEAKWHGYTWKPARILGPVTYRNTDFTHAVVVQFDDGTESVYAVSPTGEGEEYFTVRNVSETVQETWVCMYKDGSAGSPFYSKQEADNGAIERPFAYFFTRHFADGSSTNEFIPVN